MSVDVPPPVIAGVGRPRRSGPPPPVGRSRRTLGPGGGALLGSRIVLIVMAAITLMTAALAVGMRLDDRQIERHRGTATATVLSVSSLRTGIEYVDGSGVTVRPPDGVLYPGLLVVGAQFMVEYSTMDPTVVRVAGRTAAVGDLVLGRTVVLTWLAGAALVWWLRRRWRTRSGRPVRRFGRPSRGRKLGASG